MFCGAELQINISDLKIVRVPSFSSGATTFPLPAYHTSRTIRRAALRPWNLGVNYLPPPAIHLSPPSVPNTVR